MSLTTDILLACAAGLTLAWLVAAQRQFVARAARRFVSLPRVEQALLVLAVGVMTVCAQKSGSNVVFNAEIAENGRRGEDAATQSGSGLQTASAKEETAPFEAVGRPLPLSEDASVASNTSMLRAKTPLTSSSTNPCESVKSVALTSNDLARGFALTRVGTNEVFDFSAPEGANFATNWMLHGGATARTRLRFDDWTFPFGDGCLTNLTAFMFGVIAPDLYNENLRIAPLQASLGFVAGHAGFSACTAETRSVSEGTFAVGEPEGRTSGCENGDLRKETRSSSLTSATSDASVLRAKASSFWSFLTPSNSLIITWQNVLLHRLPENPVSFQVEFFANGDFTYRYDFSRLPSDAVLTNAYVIAAPGVGEPFVLWEYFLTRRFRSLGDAEEIFEEGVS